MRRVPRSGGRGRAGGAGAGVAAGRGRRHPCDGGAGAGAPRGLLARGATVGRYVILGLVGRGGMGEVYAAYDPELDRKIALKLLNDGGAASESQARSRGRLLSEAKAIARLSHPNVVVVHDAGTIDDRVFIAMEFVEGQTLAAWLGGKPRAWAEIRAVFLAAGRGLAAAHAAGIVHRDFKPQNVMVAADGAVRVMDFGLASDAGDGDGRRRPVEPVDRDHADFSRTMARRADPHRSADRNAGVHGARAVPRPGRRRAHRSVQLLRLALRGAVRRAAVRRRFARRAGRGGHRRAAARAAAPRARVPAWLRKVVAARARGETRGPLRRRWTTCSRRSPAIRSASAGACWSASASPACCSRAARSASARCRVPARRCAGTRPTGWRRSGSCRTRIRRRRTRAGTRSAPPSSRPAPGAPPTSGSGPPRSSTATPRRWAAMYGETCEATHVRGEQSTEVLDLRMDCLNRNRDSLRALTDVLADGGRRHGQQGDRRGRRAARRRALRRRGGAARGASRAARSAAAPAGRSFAPARRRGPRARRCRSLEAGDREGAAAARRGGEAGLRARGRRSVGTAGPAGRDDGQRQASSRVQRAGACGWPRRSATTRSRRGRP